MKIKDASRNQLERAVSEIREILFWDTDTDSWNIDKEWEAADFLDMIADVIGNNGLTPKEGD